ncbi:MAG: SDR family NAD(P)-dependent oxidoreductase [Pseudobdellovibrio sp.]
MSHPKYAVVTGGGRGIGKQVSLDLAGLGYEVILLGRNKADLVTTAEEIRKKGGRSQFFICDVGNEEEIKSFFSELKKQIPKLDLLVNNAGVLSQGEASLLQLKSEAVLATLQVNSMGPIFMIQNAVELLKKSDNAQIINVSSGMGSITEMGSGYASYRLSKLMLNGITRILAQELSQYNIRINSVCPGWVKTDMGGAGAPRSIEEGSRSVLAPLNFKDTKTTGRFFRDGKEIAF